MVAHWIVGNRHLIVYPYPVTILFPVVFAWADRGTPLASLMTVQQSVLAVDDDVYRGRVRVGSSSRGAIDDSPCHPAARIATRVAGLCQVLRVHHFDHHKCVYGMA